MNLPNAAINPPGTRRPDAPSAARLLLLAVALALIQPAFGQQPAETETSAALVQRLEAHMGQPRFARARWGVAVLSLDSGKTVFERDAGKLMILASNTKLFTAALALERLGPERRFQTLVFAAAKPSAEGVISGDLVIRGAGDPSFNARFQGGAGTAALQPLVNAIVAAGVKRVEGGLVGDNRRFRAMPWGAGWEWDDLRWAYGPPVSALCLDDNAFGILVKPAKQPGAPCEIVTRGGGLQLLNLSRTLPAGAAPAIDFQRAPGQNTLLITGGLPAGGAPHAEMLSVANPALWFVQELKDALAQRGVTVAGRVRALEWWDPAPAEDAALVELAHASSPHVRDLAKDMMKQSDNLGAQLLFLQAGLDAAGPGKESSSEQAGLVEMRKLLRQAGVKPGAVVFKEGAGLWRGSEAAPSAMTAFLAWMAARPLAQTIVDCLPVAGVDGTLADRFKGTGAEKRIWAKTGTMDGVSALSGYMVTVGGERLAFSILLNDCHDLPAGRVPHDETDALARMLAEFSGRWTTAAR